MRLIYVTVLNIDSYDIVNRRIAFDMTKRALSIIVDRLFDAKIINIQNILPIGEEPTHM